ncbi:MAG: alpha-E domain-containing protein [Gammaproteobacteria bacterium TMED225]|jgi:uncharacterized alpha-E superfamily protein|nr:MAG: alpha-E domain-containing protein [Gammaproteobacteria bacterium TMED225]
MLSSIAEKIFWLSRYIERIENTSRLINVNSDLLLDIPHDESNDLKHLIKITGHIKDFKKKNTKENVFTFLIEDENNPSSIKYSIEMAKMNSRYLLTMLPKSAWEQFNNLYSDFNNNDKKNSEDLYQIIRNSQRFFAIISDGMQRNDVFNFIKLGRFIERADMLSRIIEDQILRKETHVNKYYQNLQWSSVLKSINGYESFKTLNKENLNQEIVLNFMIMESLFPRSIKYCVDKLDEVQKYLPKSVQIKKTTKKLLDGFSKQNIYKNDKKILKQLDNFQLGLIMLDKEISQRFFLTDS